MSEVSGAGHSLRLDELYYMVAYIYSEQNAERSRTDTFAHFVEVCSFLTSWETHKPRGDVDIETALCKALGWFFPLAAKLRIRSLEAVVLRKYPRVCPYCESPSHRPDICNSGKQPNFDQLKERFEKITAPVSLNEWQGMFNQIYPREPQTRKSAIGLFEELGELAEALRFYDRYPNYALGEMADVFSYIMGLANEYSANSQPPWSFDFQNRFLSEYPGMCPGCRKSVCDCAGLPEHARVAKEVPIKVATDIVPHPQSFLDMWKEKVAERAAHLASSSAARREIRRAIRRRGIEDLAAAREELGDLAGVEDAAWGKTDPKALLAQWGEPIVEGLKRILQAETKQEWGTAIDQLNEIAKALLFRALELDGASIGFAQNDIQAVASNNLDYGAVVARQQVLERWRWVRHLAALYELRTAHIVPKGKVQPVPTPTPEDWRTASSLFQRGAGECCKLILGAIQPRP